MEMQGVFFLLTENSLGGFKGIRIEKNSEKETEKNIRKKRNNCELTIGAFRKRVVGSLEEKSKGR